MNGFAIMRQVDGKKVYLSGFGPGDYLWGPAEAPHHPRRIPTQTEAEAVRAVFPGAEIAEYPEVVEFFFLLECKGCGFYYWTDLISARQLWEQKEEHDAICGKKGTAELSLRREVPRPPPPRPYVPAVAMADIPTRRGR